MPSAAALQLCATGGCTTGVVRDTPCLRQPLVHGYSRERPHSPQPSDAAIRPKAAQQGDWLRQRAGPTSSVSGKWRPLDSPATNPDAGCIPMHTEKPERRALSCSLRRETVEVGRATARRLRGIIVAKQRLCGQTCIRKPANS